MKKNTIKVLKPNIIYLFLIAFFAFWGMSGYGSIGNYTSAVFCVLLVVFDLISGNKNQISKHTLQGKMVVCFCVFFGYHFLMSLFNISGIVYWLGNIIVFVFMTYYCVLIQNRVINYENDITKKYCLKILLTIWIFLTVYSIVYYIRHPESAREAIAYQELYDNTFLGGAYNLAFGSCILGLYIFSLLVNKRIIKHRLFYFILVILFSIHVFLTKSALTTIFLFLGLVLILLFSNRATKKNRGKIIAITFFVVLAFLFTKEYIGNFLMNISDYASDNLYGRRLYELGTVLNGTSYTRHTNERLSKIGMSFSQFLSSPIFGMGYKYGFKFSLMANAGLGTHSDIFDMLAEYGIIIFSFWISIFIFNIVNIVKNHGISTNMWVVILVFMMVFNPFVSFQTMIALFLIIPLLNDKFRENGL